MKLVHFATVATSLIAALGLHAAGPASAAPAADPWKPCSTAGSYWAPNDKDGSTWGKYFRYNATKLRQTASTSAMACAEGQTSHTVDLHCYRLVNGVYWNYVRDVTTGGWAGWARDADLTVVSAVPC